MDGEPRPPSDSERARDPADVERKALGRLRELVDRRSGRPLSDAELVELPRLYRLACSVLARLESRGARPRATHEVRRLVDGSQVLLLRDRDLADEPNARRLSGFLRATFDALFVRGPRAVRAEWRLVGTTFLLFYGLAAVAWIAVAQDLELSYALLSPPVVENQIAQLEATGAGEPFRGNFNFGWSESPTTAAWIMVHNMGVGVLFFVAALVPPFYLFLLMRNALMVGSYTAVAGHWDQAGAISSILWCHGTLELQALILSGAAGLVLFRALLFPGIWTRATALALAARRAVDLFLPMFGLLFVAGLIEGFVSPHAGLGVRLSFAIGTGILLVLWATLCGRGPDLRSPRGRTDRAG